MDNLQTTKINNRRYLGNKYRLLPFILDVVNNNCTDIESIADIFSGTGAVSSAFSTSKIIITNDILYSNYICNLAWFSPLTYDENKIKQYLIRYNQISNYEENYMSLNFSDTYFSKDVCSKIGIIREDIEKEYLSRKLNERERAILITSLLYAMDSIAQTCGHYDAYRKNSEEFKPLILKLPLASNSNNKENRCYNQDANILVKSIRADLVYIDPPYNSRQYCDSYHLLENVASWDKPAVYGVAKKMKRDNLKSDYCTIKASEAFKNLIEDINSKYILVSYNNTGVKANERSNAKILDSDIVNILKQKGELQIFSQDYKMFSTGKSNIKDNEERLFLCKCKKN